MNLKEFFNDKKKRIAVIIFGFIALIFAAVCIFVGIPLVKYVQEPERFRSLISSLGIWGGLAYVALLIFQIIFAFIPGEPFEMLAGYAFGALEGTILCVIASCIGSAIVFLLTRKFGIKFVELFFSMEKINSVGFLKEKNKLATIIFLVFFIPGTPKDLLSYVAGLTNINFWSYLLISSVAKLPSIITSTVGANAMAEQNYTFAIIVFVITGVISVIGLLIYNLMFTKKKKTTASNEKISVEAKDNK